MTTTNKNAVSVYLNGKEASEATVDDLVANIEHINDVKVTVEGGEPNWMRLATRPDVTALMDKKGKVYALRINLPAVDDHHQIEDARTAFRDTLNNVVRDIIEG